MRAKTRTFDPAQPLNQPEEDIGKARSAEIKELLTRERLEAISICGKVEMEVSERFARSCYRLLDLVSSFLCFMSRVP